MDLDATHSVAESNYNFRNRKTVKYPNKIWCTKKKKKNRKLCIVKNCNDSVDNLIKDEQVYISDTSFSASETKLNLESQMLKLQLTDVKTITTNRKWPKKAVTCEDVLDDTSAIEDFIGEFVGYLEEAKKKRTNYQEMVECKQEESGDGVKILSVEITDEDRLETCIALSQSQLYLELMMGNCK